MQCEQRPSGSPSVLAPPIAIAPSSAEISSRFTHAGSHIRPPLLKGSDPGSDPVSGFVPALLRAVAKRIEFERSDVHLAGVLFERLHAKRGRWERLGDARRWLVIEPASGEPDVKIEINVGDGDPDAMNLILNVTGVEPGKAVYPDLAEQGVKTPSGWVLMADVGWVIAWRLPKDTPFEQVTDFAFRGTKALSGEPSDGRWKAWLEKRGPRPGYTNPKI